MGARFWRDGGRATWFGWGFCPTSVRVEAVPAVAYDRAT